MFNPFKKKTFVEKRRALRKKIRAYERYQQKNRLATWQWRKYSKLKSEYIQLFVDFYQKHLSNFGTDLTATKLVDENGQELSSFDFKSRAADIVLGPEPDKRYLSANWKKERVYDPTTQTYTYEWQEVEPSPVTTVHIDDEGVVYFMTGGVREEDLFPKHWTEHAVFYKHEERARLRDELAEAERLHHEKHKND